MASVPAFDPSQPFEAVGAPPFDPNKPFEAVDHSASSLEGASKTAKAWEPPRGTGLLAPVTDVPREAYNATSEAIDVAAHYLNPFSAERRVAAKEGDVLGPMADLGKGALAAVSAPMGPVIGAARSLLGHPLAAAMPTSTPEEQARLRKAGVSEGLIPSATADENYEKAKGGVDTALEGLTPRGATPRGMVAPTPVPAAPAPNGPLGVTLSEGQLTGELPLIQREQAALRGAMGDTAQARAQEFANQQRGQVAAAGEDVARQLDPFGQRVAETPQEASQLVSQGLQQAAAQRKAGVTKAYDEAKALPGEIHAGAFEGIGQKIKGELSLRDDPIIIDDKLTPFASRAIQDVEDRISKLTIQNRADPFGQPNPQNIVGVDLKGVDQIRRRLSSFRNDAFRSGNAADGRAAKAVLDSFDNQVDAAVNGGLFKGDPRAVQAWNDARAAHADYKNTFSAGKGDPVGRVVERILGKGKNEAAIPNDVADFLYGSSGVNPNSLNVGVAKRVRDVLGDQSPEWSGVKQGMFQRLTEAGPGATEWGPGKIAQRINKFLNADGTEMSHTLYSPSERALLQRYADLQRRIEVPQAGANWSNTSTVLAPIMRKISGGLAGVVGALLGHAVAPGLYGVGEAAGAAAASKVGSVITGAREARRISEQMPLVTDQIKQWQRAVSAANRSNTPLTQRSAAIASSNLAQALHRIGIDPAALASPMQGVATGHADQQQQ